MTNPTNATFTNFKVQDADTLSVLIRFADSQGSKIVRVVPINDGFAVRVTGSVEISNQTDLEPFKADVDPRRTYWAEIAQVDDSALRFLEILED